MKLPIEWIKEYVPVDLSAEKLADMLTMAGLEVEETEESEIGPVLNIKVTPNRGDCLSVIGVSRELSAATGISLKPAPAERSTGPGEAGQLTSVSVEDPDLCPRYAARIIRNTRRGPSPKWIQDRLTAAGMRPVSNIVDVTNYVMLETGQPLHAFDLERLGGQRIVVRRAKACETLKTLDDVDRTLTPDMLVICDAERPVAVAGVMGGANAEMRPGTKTVLLESAHFNRLSVRKTAKVLGLHTEASYRFERIVDPSGVAAAADRACSMIQELGMGDVVDGVIDVYPQPVANKVIALRPERVSLLLGFPVTIDEIARSLSALGFGVSPGDQSLGIAIPAWRPDVVREADLVEEVGRVLGYERIPERLPHGSSTQGSDSEHSRFVNRIRSILAGAGLQEVVSHSLLAPGPFETTEDNSDRVTIRSALSAELSGLRRSLLPGLIEALERNARRGQSPLAFFETGNVFRANANGQSKETGSVAAIVCGPMAKGSWQRDSRVGPADYYTARGIIERISEGLGIEGPSFRAAGNSRFHPGRSAEVLVGNMVSGYVGELHPELTAGLTVRDRVVYFELLLEAVCASTSTANRFKPLFLYPSIVRDLAPRVGIDIPYSSIDAAIDDLKIVILEKCELTDVFSGSPLPEGLKSLTISLTFRSPERTLTDQEVNEALARIRASLETACGASFAG